MKISVIMPIFNRGPRLKKSVDSILAQSYKDFELIIVNDGSTDDSEEIIKGYADPRIVYFKKGNGGQASARNLGISHAKGIYIAYCDHDDLFHKEHLEKLSLYLDGHPDVDVVYSNANFINHGIFEYVTDFEHPQKKPENDLYFVPMPSTMMHRKVALKKTGPWDDSRVIKMGGEDWDLWLRFKDKLKIAHLKEALTDYVMHGGNMNTGKIRIKEIILTRLYVFSKRFAAKLKTQGLFNALLGAVKEFGRVFG
ncbi:MAG: glycosyltransferase family A protein [Candidatus Margulisiibacteriota bacterium]